MGDKKGKALALELMDDLLKDDGTQKQETPDDGTTVRPSTPASARDDDATVDLNAAARSRKPDAPTVPISIPNDATEPIPAVPQEAEPPSRGRDDRARTSVGRHAAFRQSGAPSATEAALAQSESLRIAQQRILELEQELERLRLQNEELGAAGETLRRRADELLAQNSKRENDYENAVSTFNQEREILSGSKEALQRDLELARRKNEELELRISTNIQKIRVRERELENRLELVKMESAALIRAKDEMILDLKRQKDQLNMELANYRNKNQELNRQTNDKQEMLRRTVKALRLALSMLEGEEEQSPQRKAK
jgi:predicted  nucleic acid-binding Zn-ribbon protein